jgi:hypothetical protein
MCLSKIPYWIGQKRQMRWLMLKVRQLFSIHFFNTPDHSAYEIENANRNTSSAGNAAGNTGESTPGLTQPDWYPQNKLDIVKRKLNRDNPAGK